MRRTEFGILLCVPHTKNFLMSLSPQMDEHFDSVTPGQDIYRCSTQFDNLMNMIKG